MAAASRHLVFALAGYLLAAGCSGGDDHGEVSARVDGGPSQVNAAPARAPEGDSRRQPGEFLAFVPARREPREIEVVSTAVTVAPTIDGRADEPLWEAARSATTLDFASQREITLKSVHTADRIFFLVVYPDAAPSETHKTWGWDPKQGIYRQMSDREDMFVFKWSMVGNGVGLALRAPEPHRADIWFWKARRTNPVGYADDKWQLLTVEHRRKGKKISSSNGVLYLRRVGDSGRSAYEERRYYEYREAALPKYHPREPQGSRADIRARGVWRDGRWTIEFARSLDTGNDDDISFAPGRVYLFAVSCYEIAGSKINPAWSQPLYRSGDAFDRLLLRLAGQVS